MFASYDPSASPLPDQPGALLIHLLDRCNLSCQHCYMDASPRQNTCLPLEWVTRSLAEVNRLGIYTIYLSGGEPFLYPEFPQVLEAASQLQGVDVCVCSNGTLIGPKEVQLLHDSKARIQVSIDGPEAYHNQFRGSEEAFRRTQRAIQQLVDAGVAVAVVITVCRDNIASLPWLANWAAEVGVERISVQPLLELGRGAKISNKKLSEEELCDLFLQLSDLGHTYRERGLRFSLSYRTRSFLLVHPCAAYVCNGAQCHRRVNKEIKKLIIREDGTVLPEIPTLHYRYALGNLREGTLTDLVAGYMANGYAGFEHLCRTVYKEVMPFWTSPLIPWDEIVAEHSWALNSSPIEALHSVA